MNPVKVVARMEFVYSRMGNVNYLKVARKDHKTKLLANLNLIHVILVQTHKMLHLVTFILVIQKQEDQLVYQYLILGSLYIKYVLIMGHNVFLHNQ